MTMRSFGWTLVVVGVAASILVLVAGFPPSYVGVLALVTASGIVVIIQTKKLILEGDRELVWGPDGALRDWSLLNTSDQYKLALTDRALLFGSYFGRESDQQVVSIQEMESYTVSGWRGVRIARTNGETLRFALRHPGARRKFTDALKSLGVKERGKSL